MAETKYLIGNIKPATAGTGFSDTEMSQMLPSNVSVTTVALGIQQLAASQIQGALSRIEGAAAELARRKVDGISMNGTPPVVYGGYGFDKKIIERIGKVTSVPATTSQTSAMKAMELFKVKKLVLVVPWGDYINGYLIKFLNDSGIEVASSKMANAELKDFPGIPLSRSYAMCLEGLREAPDADCIYIPCSSWPFNENIEPLEKETGIPVIASTQSMLWGSLRLVGVTKSITGFGRLLRDH